MCFYGDAMRCVANVMLNVTAAQDCEKSHVHALEKLEFLRCIMYFYGFESVQVLTKKEGFCFFWEQIRKNNGFSGA